MISCTFIVYRQFRYLQEADTGIDKELIVSVPLHQPDKGRETVEKLRILLAADPHIVCVSGSNINLGRGSDHRSVQVGTGFVYHNRRINTEMADVDYDYLKTLGIRPSAGREFDKSFAMDTVQHVVISESMANQLGEKDPVGKIIGDDSSVQGHMRVIGVFPDFHLYSMAESIQPLTLVMDTHASLDYCFVRTSGHDPIGAMATIRKAMAVVEPQQDFNGSFVDENINNWYSDEQIMSLLFSLAAGIAIIISCTGLLAMVLLVIQQRVKEIGVRKVLGASVGNISFSIAKDFLQLVGLAVLIATPVSWLAMQKWLNGFPYRINIQFWMFLIVALLAFVLSSLTIGIHTIRAARQNPVKALRSE
jgi:ABC-type antimicrobial peptide transport system permease subunit